MTSGFHPTRPPSRGATAYHKAVAYTSWHKENIRPTLKVLEKVIDKNDIIVDFGAGTGSSAIYFLKILKPDCRLLLVDNSPSWLSFAYKLLHKNKKVSFFLLEKTNGKYATLDKVIGGNKANHVISANTVHLIPNISETFRGIYLALKKGGAFSFQSGNIEKITRKNGILTIDDSIIKVHDIGIDIIKKDMRFRKYKKGLSRRISEQIPQRKFVFPTPRPIEFYLNSLKSIGFKNEKVTNKLIKVKYSDWLNFLRVRRLQAGILPEIGGKDANPAEEEDRDLLITLASRQLFSQLKKRNPHANSSSFTAEWTYVTCKK